MTCICRLWFRCGLTTSIDTVCDNRAQAHQLNKDQDAALEDLNKAVEFAGRDRDVLKQALSQRGTILKAQGKDEEARADFEFAAKLGSTFAKVEAVGLNPYAALCNKFLTQALKEHQEALPQEWKPAADALKEPSSTA